VRVGAAQEGEVQHPRQHDVIDEAAPAAQHPGIFHPPDRSADEAIAQER
jgi:hypothetical protein